MPSMRVEKSSRHDYTFAEQTSNKFPMRAVSNCKLDFMNASLSHVEALRIILVLGIDRILGRTRLPQKML